MRRRESREAGLWLGTAPHRALVADLPARARRGARIRGDGGRVVVRLDLDEHVDGFPHRPVDAAPDIREEAVRPAALDDGGVVRVRGQDPCAIDAPVGVADHPEQRVLRRRSVHVPGGVEDLVPAVLRVGLREHHQFDVRRLPVQVGVLRRQVGDLVRRESEPQAPVRIAQRRFAPPGTHHRSRLPLGEDVVEAFLDPGDLGHAVVEDRGDFRMVAAVHEPADAAFNPTHTVETAAAEDVGGLAGPRRDRAGPRRHRAHARSDTRRQVVARTIGKKCRHDVGLFGCHGAVHVEEVHELRIHAAHRRVDRAQCGQAFREAGRGVGRRTRQDLD